MYGCNLTFSGFVTLQNVTESVTFQRYGFSVTLMDYSMVRMYDYACGQTFPIGPLVGFANWRSSLQLHRVNACYGARTFGAGSQTTLAYSQPDVSLSRVIYKTQSVYSILSLRSSGK